jgi:hypothetical protein
MYRAEKKKTPADTIRKKPDNQGESADAKI